MSRWELTIGVGEAEIRRWPDGPVIIGRARQGHDAVPDAVWQFIVDALNAAEERAAASSPPADRIGVAEFMAAQMHGYKRLQELTDRSTSGERAKPTGTDTVELTSEPTFSRMAIWTPIQE